MSDDIDLLEEQLQKRLLDRIIRKVRKDIMGLFNFGNTPDWVSKNESDGETFYGYNDGEGRTNWYDKRGTLDSSTDTPSDDDCDDYLRRY